jgi:enoyl-CoA hydratase/carnithine racemase
VPADELEAVTMKLAESIAARSPAAMALGLNAFYTSQDMEYIQQLPYLQQQLGAVLALEDAAEGISAFFAKRQPKWKGK